MVEPVKIELGIAREQIDVEVRVGVALDKCGARDAAAVGDELVEAGLRGLDRVQARRQTVEGALELVDGRARRGWDRDIRDAADGIAREVQSDHRAVAGRLERDVGADRVQPVA